jgi:hypothetical protein
VGWGFLAIGDDGFDVRESRAFQHGGEVAFREAEPAVGVEFAGFLEVVLEEVEDDEAAAGFEDSEGGVEGALGVFRVMEGLAKDGEVEGLVIDGWFFEIAEAVFEVVKAVGAGEGLSELDHFRGEVDSDDLFGALGEELGEGSFAGTEVCDDFEIEHFEECFGEGFPGAAGDVVFSEAAGEFVEVGACLVFAFAEKVAEGGAVFGDFAKLFGGEFGDFQEVRGGGAGVDVVLSAAEVFDESGGLELGELGGDAALAHAEDFL